MAKTRRWMLAVAGEAGLAVMVPPLLAACGGTQSSSGGGSASSGVANAKIGTAFTLTGGAAVYGTAQKNAVQLAADEINKGAVSGVKLDVLYEDDGGDKGPGTNVFQKFINQDKVTIIMGPTLSAVALAADPVAQQAGVPVLGVSNTANGVTDIGNFIFRDSLTDALQIPGAVKKAKDKLNIKKAAIIYANDDDFSKSGFDVFKKQCDANGIQVTSSQAIATNDKDFSAQLTQIKGTSPDALMISTLIAPAVGIVTQARQLLGDTIPMIGGNGLNSPALMSQAGKAAEGVVVGAAWLASSSASSGNPKSQAFIKAYKDKYNADPDQFAAQAYAGVYIIADALKRAGANVTRDSLRKALSETKNLQTVLGSFSFTSARDADHPSVVQQVKDGKFVAFE